MAATLASGLVVSKDNGCGWGYVPSNVPRDLFIDIAGRKSTPSVAFAISSKFAGQYTDAGGLLFRSELFATSDAGTTWAKVGAAFDPSLLLETVDLTESNPQRVYVSAIRGSGASVQGVFLVSDDGGATFRERSVPLIPNEDRAPFIGAVSPTNADVVYVRTSATPGKPNRLLVTTDAGRTWTEKHKTTGAMLGFALSHDGSRVYLGSQEDGLWSASASDLVFSKKSSVQVQCLAAGANGLWACSNEVSGFVVGFSGDEGATFEPRLRLSGLRGPLECPAGSTTHDKCLPDWPRQRNELGIPTADAGNPDAGGPDATVDARSGDKGNKCGCAVHDGSTGFGLAIVGISVAVALRAARRIRTQERRSQED